MATHSSILAWRIPWTEEPGGLQSMRSQESDTTQRLNHHHHHRWVQGLKTTTSQDLELNYLFSGAWSGFNFMFPKNRVWMGETKQGNFKQKNPGKHHVGQVIKVNMASDKSFLTICTSCCAVLGRALHFWDTFLEAHDSSLIMRKTSEKPKLREIPQNT